MSLSEKPSRLLELLLFFGTLLVHVINVVVVDRPDLIWDEARYSWYAESLTHGTYATTEKPDIINGPGYPLVLAPLIAAGAPLMVMRGLNALFMALAAVFILRAVLPYAGRKWAIGVSLFTVLHPSLIRTAPYLMTEALALCCIAGFAWAFTAALRSEKKAWGPVLAAAFAFAWLTLTRVFFGNVILVTSFFLVCLFVSKKHRQAVLRSLTMMTLSFVMCVPWLLYTKSKTGEALCWSTNGGELLYWATSTNEGENGHWFSEEDAQNKPELVASGHRDFYKANYYLPVREREAALKKKAMENLRANPTGVLKNWICNWGRLVFGMPRSHQPEELLMLVLVAVNAPVVLLVFATLVVGWRNRRALPPELLLLTLITLIYLGGTSLLPALPRYSVVVFPWIGLVIAAVLAKGLRIELNTAK